MLSLPLSKAYRLLEPGPVVLVSTSIGGRANLMAMSYHMMIQDEPPLIACGLGPWNFSHEALRATRECVIAVPGADLLEQVVDIGNCSGETTDKFKTFSLTPLPAKTVAPPLVAECLANMECRVRDDAWAEPYNLWVLEVTRAWVNPAPADRRRIHHNGDGTFVLDGEVRNLKDRMVRWPSYIAD